MAKFDNPLDAMASMPDSQDERRTTPPRRKRARVGDFVNPLDDVSTADKARAVDSSLVAGQYIRRTFTFTPGQLARIKAIARELHISETGIARWLIDQGLDQWEQGVRPEVEERAVRLEPKLKYS
jgi:transposase-like protein